MTSTMNHHYDASHDKLTSAINQRLLSSHEFIEDYSTINPHQSNNQVDTRLDVHFRLISGEFPVHKWPSLGRSGHFIKVQQDLANGRH